MIKKILAAGLVTAGLTGGAIGMLANNASATSTPGGCPSDKWVIFPPAPGDEKADKNGDGLICVRFVNGNGSSAFSNFDIKDNNNPV